MYFGAVTAVRVVRSAVFRDTPNAGLYSRIYKAAICLVNEHIAVIIIHLGPTLDRAFVCDEQTLRWSLSKEPSDSIMLNE